MGRIDPSRYLQWSCDELVLWICSLDNGRYSQYKDKLLTAFREQGVNGTAIHYMDKSDLKGFGVDAFGDRGNIYEHIQNLVNKNKMNDNQNANISQGKEGQDDTNYMQ